MVCDDVLFKEEEGIRDRLVTGVQTCALPISEKFGHNKIFRYDNYNILTSYHPSKQNTQTGRLTWKEWFAVFTKAKRLIQI